LSNLKPIPWPHDLIPQVDQLCEVLNEGPDLACALIGGTFVDHCLGALLQKYLVKGHPTSRLLQPGKGLGDFGSRRLLCESLGLITGPQSADIEIIGHIRNRFAHHFFDVRFSDEETAKMCDRTKI
jgi:hypothetical protein